MYGNGERQKFEFKNRGAFYRWNLLANYSVETRKQVFQKTYSASVLMNFLTILKRNEKTYGQTKKTKKQLQKK